MEYLSEIKGAAQDQANEILSVRTVGTGLVLLGLLGIEIYIALDLESYYGAFGFSVVYILGLGAMLVAMERKWGLNKNKSLITGTWSWTLYMMLVGTLFLSMGIAESLYGDESKACEDKYGDDSDAYDACFEPYFKKFFIIFLFVSAIPHLLATLALYFIKHKSVGLLASNAFLGTSWMVFCIAASISPKKPWSLLLHIFFYCSVAFLLVCTVIGARIGLPTFTPTARFTQERRDETLAYFGRLANISSLFFAGILIYELKLYDKDDDDDRAYRIGEWFAYLVISILLALPTLLIGSSFPAAMAAFGVYHFVINMADRLGSFAEDENASYSIVLSISIIAGLLFIYTAVYLKALGIQNLQSALLRGVGYRRQRGTIVDQTPEEIKAQQDKAAQESEEQKQKNLDTLLATLVQRGASICSGAVFGVAYLSSGESLWYIPFAIVVLFGLLSAYIARSFEKKVSKFEKAANENEDENVEVNTKTLSREALVSSVSVLWVLAHLNFLVAMGDLIFNVISKKSSAAWISIAVVSVPSILLAIFLYRRNPLPALLASLEVSFLSIGVFIDLAVTGSSDNIDWFVLVVSVLVMTVTTSMFLRRKCKKVLKTWILQSNALLFIGSLGSAFNFEFFDSSGSNILKWIFFLIVGCLVLTSFGIIAVEPKVTSFSGLAIAAFVLWIGSVVSDEIGDLASLGVIAGIGLVLVILSFYTSKPFKRFEASVQACFGINQKLLPQKTAEDPQSSPKLESEGPSREAGQDADGAPSTIVDVPAATEATSAPEAAAPKEEEEEEEPEGVGAVGGMFG